MKEKKNNLSEQENDAKMNEAGSPAALKLDESESRQFVWKEIIIENKKKNPLLIIKYLGSVSAMYIIYCLGCTGNTSHMENETSRYSK